MPTCRPDRTVSADTVRSVRAVHAQDWDARYAEKAQWSAEPNALVAQLCADLTPGVAVDLAAGEGRHALWLAGRGWQATAV
ncbi:MAG: Methyltransferase type 11, partial [Klenkia sp.]|nr:Methyltransferase type 11 [Klenkia sp.]